MLIPQLPPTTLPSGPVGPGTVLFTNAPNGVLIKPLPIELSAREQIGLRDGYASLDDAIAAVATLTRENNTAAAIVRDGARYVAHALLSSWSFELNAHVSGPLRNFGGIQWKHDQLAAIVDDTWVERLA